MGEGRDLAELRGRRFVFKDRASAGRLLAEKLSEIEWFSPLILAIPCGGVPVAFEVATRLQAPLDLVIPRKLPIPQNPEAGFGALAQDGVKVLNEPLLTQLGLGGEVVEEIAQRALKEIERRERLYRRGRPYPQLSERSVILVDDGLASGYTMLAAVTWARRRGVRGVSVAVPTGSLGAVRLVSPEVDLLLCLNVRDEPVFAVADAYEEWRDLGDEEVLEYLNRAWNIGGGEAPSFKPKGVI